MKIKKITTAVIPAGGWGTRFLPSTKSIPKEMFPLGSKPVILHVVEELVASGIDNIIFVVSHHKQPIESFFAPNELLENYISQVSGKKKGEELKAISKMANFSFVYTQEPKGNGGALNSVKHLIKDEAFVLVWSDEIILSKNKPRVAQCLDAYYKYGKPVISAIEIEDAQKRQKYGMAELQDIEGDEDVKEIIRIAEKPAPGTEPSVYAAHGAYILTPAIFSALDKIKAQKDGEIWLTDAINIMKEKTGLIAKIIRNGHYLDCGNPLDYLLSQVDYFMNYSEFKEEACIALAKPVCKREE